jgi:hypothetical protein
MSGAGRRNLDAERQREPMDFPTWIALGTYGGLGCALLAAGSVSLLALRLRRGSGQQIARASLLSLLACALMLPAIWWLLRRVDVYGPLLSGQEVTFWLVWISLFGWMIPLLTTAVFFAFASPEVGQTEGQPRVSGAPVATTPLNDPARQFYPYGPDRPWGRLTPVEDGAAPAIDLSLEVTSSSTTISSPGATPSRAGAPDGRSCWIVAA